jgi:hypothetical protein
MFQQLVPVNKARHAGTKIRQIEGYEFASQFHIASVMVHEFARASAIYPVVFLEDKTQDEFRPVALMGLEQGENLFVDAHGKWHASYVPAIIRRYPFALAGTGQEGQFTVCIDEGSALVNRDVGVPLFKEDGEPSEAIESVKRYLGELQQMDVFTRAFCKYFAEHNLFTPLNMRVRQGARARSISGCYVVNEDRLNNLSDERFIEMRERRYLPAVYAHLMSLAQIDRLLQLSEERQAPVVSPPQVEPA